MLRRGAGQQVAASALLMAGIVCEEVLKEAWRRLAYGSESACAGGTVVKTKLPGAMADLYFGERIVW